MIIRLIGDNWIPEDKVLVSVREDDEVKASLPNIMKKLAIKRMEEYKLYHVRDGRKCDYERPIHLKYTWKQFGFSTGGLIYLSKKEPPIVEKVLETVKKNETVQYEQDQHKDFTPESDAVGTFPIVAQDIGENKNDNLDSFTQLPHGSSSKEKIPLKSSFLQVPLHNQEDNLVLRPNSSEKELKTDIPISKSSNDYICRDEGNDVSALRPGKFLLESDSNIEGKEVLPLPVSLNVDYRSFNNPKVTTSPILKEHSVGEIDNDFFMRRCERTAYVVSLYEFAHLESQRQHQRAEKLLNDVQRRPPHTPPVTTKPLYRI
ncbi:uncharacterized protein TM35_000074340 [Trypanosoma theileri]|uniref:Uncharacterized protein n=1 Tax=Trypanosoma theileri TaxID=67003 RepID=A0A1X0P3L4_9TRYP|nr:uncharacterized protein TM35_000074340 [Trypanosoma theileri]ORC91010.1 hypothetical protein TM35_000074340 [Trypanosoma theileri]